LYRGRLADATMRLRDVLLAFPAILLAILFAAVFQPCRLTAMTAIGTALVPVFALVVRGAGLHVILCLGETLQERQAAAAGAQAVRRDGHVAHLVADQRHGAAPRQGRRSPPLGVRTPLDKPARPAR